MTSRYVIGSEADMGSHYILMSVEHPPLDLRDAIEACRAKNERHLRIWPDSNLRYHIYRLEKVPSYIETADLKNSPNWGGGEDPQPMRPEFAAYLESSEALAPKMGYCDNDCCQETVPLGKEHCRGYPVLPFDESADGAL